jgi:hypothetical protein
MKLPRYGLSFESLREERKREVTGSNLLKEELASGVRLTGLHGPATRKRDSHALVNLAILAFNDSANGAAMRCFGRGRDGQICDGLRGYEGCAGGNNQQQNAIAE